MPEPATSARPAPAGLEEAVAALGPGWRLLGGLAAGGAPLPPALAHPGIGIALLDPGPAASGDAVPRLRAALEAGGFHQAFPGHLPVVHRSLTPEHLGRLPDILDYAFSWEEPLALHDGEGWVALAERLLTPGPAAEAAPPATPPAAAAPPADRAEAPPERAQALRAAVRRRQRARLAAGGALALAVLAAAWLEPPPPPASRALSSVAGADAPIPAADLPPATVAALLREADGLLAMGELAAARQAYLRALASASAEAATGLGRSHDPEVLARLGHRGLRGNREEAASWYRTALALGDPAAGPLLARAEAGRR